MGAHNLLVSVNEYLNTDYEPDCDYVDGVLVDRNVGEKRHAKIQKRLLIYLDARCERWGLFVIQETRMKVSATRYRVPDTCVFVGPEPDEQVFTQPPFLCIEILSPEDRLSRMRERIDDYLSFGVGYVWVVDPKAGRAWIYTPGAVSEVQDGVLRTENPAIEVPLKDILEEG